MLTCYFQVGVYRMSSERIGCSLADAASNPAYMDYLEAASLASPSLHVVYINTSLETKANAHELVPTITCTSSNVVQTILQVGDEHHLMLMPFIALVFYGIPRAHLNESGLSSLV